MHADFPIELQDPDDLVEWKALIMNHDCICCVLAAWSKYFGSSEDMVLLNLVKELTEETHFDIDGNRDSGSDQDEIIYHQNLQQYDSGVSFTDSTKAFLEDDLEFQREQREGFQQFWRASDVHEIDAASYAYLIQIGLLPEAWNNYLNDEQALLVAKELSMSTTEGSNLPLSLLISHNVIEAECRDRTGFTKQKENNRKNIQFDPFEEDGWNGPLEQVSDISEEDGDGDVESERVEPGTPIS